MKRFLMVVVLGLAASFATPSTVNAECSGPSCQVSNAPVVGQPVRNVGRFFLNNRPVRTTVGVVVSAQPVRSLVRGVVRVRPVRSVFRLVMPRVRVVRR